MLTKQLFSSLAELLIYPALALLVSMLMTYGCIRWLPRLGYLDQPGGRRIHRKPIPRGGGVAIVVAFFSVLGFYAWTRMPDNPGPGVFFRQLFYPALLLVALGLIDDRYELRSWIKLPVQLAVAWLVWYNGPEDYVLLGWSLPWYLSMVLAVIWVVAIINAFNLIDGLDGLASGLAVVSGLALAVWLIGIRQLGSEGMAMLILAGASLGFLRYNFYPARIFLGDTGSTFLGLVFAVVGMSSVTRSATFAALLVPALAIGVPIFDVMLAIWRRTVRKMLDTGSQGVMTGDQDHLHHRVLRGSRRQSTTALRLYALSAGFACVAIILLPAAELMPNVVFGMLLLLCFFVIRQYADIELFESARLIQHGLIRPRRGPLINLLHPFVDFGILLAAFIATHPHVMTAAYFHRALLAAGIPVLIGYLLGSYKVYWLRAGINDYTRLLRRLLIGILIAVWVIGVMHFRDSTSSPPDEYRHFLISMSAFVLMSGCLIGLERFLIYYAASFWMNKLALHAARSSSQHRHVLVFGGGLQCRIFIEYLYCARGATPQEEVIGIVDDDPALAGLDIHGFPVLGGSAELSTIFQQRPFDELVVTTRNLKPEKLADLQQFCRRHQIILSTCALQKKPISNISN